MIFPVLLLVQLAAVVADSNMTNATITPLTIFMYDKFGDGWGDNVRLNIMTVGEFVNCSDAPGELVDVEPRSVNFTVDCNCLEVTVCSLSNYFQVSVITTNDDPVRNPWEVVWAYKNLEGWGYFGDYDSLLTIDHDVVTDEQNMLSADVLNDDNKCQNCPAKPKAKPKGKPAPKKSGDDTAPTSSPTPEARRLDHKTSPKRPPAFVDFKLYDSEGDGWFSEYAEFYLTCDDASISLPQVLIHPEYYITSDDRTKLIKSGALCGLDREDLWCHEVLPHDGHFIFRVAGHEFVEDSTGWEFCGVSGGLNEELSFEMKKGKCIPGVKLSADNFCEGIESVATFHAILALDGITDSLTEVDTLMLQKVVTASVAGASNVVVVSTEQVDSKLNVEFSMDFSTEKAGYDGTNADMVEAFSDSIATGISNSVAQGYYMSLLNQELDSLSSSNDILTSVTGVEFISFSLYAITYTDIGSTEVSSGVSETEHVTSSVSILSNEEHNSFMSEYGTGLIAFVAIIAVGGIVLGLIAKSSRSDSNAVHVPLSDQSDHFSDVSELTYRDANGQVISRPMIRRKN